MKKLIAILAISLLLTFTSSAVAAAQERIDLGKLDPDTAAEVIKQLKQAEQIRLPTPETVQKYAGVGKEVASAIKEIALALNVEVNEFVKTPVGMTVSLLLVYKLVLSEVLKTFFALLVCLIVFLIVLKSFRHFHMQEKVSTGTDKKGKPTNWEWRPRYKFRSDDAKVVSSVVHVIILVVMAIISIALIAS